MMGEKRPEKYCGYQILPGEYQKHLLTESVLG
jgi:hypothetical protein